MSTDHTPQEEFLRDLTRERFSRPVREWRDTAPLRASHEQLAELVREVIPYSADRDGVVVIRESA